MSKQSFLFFLNKEEYSGNLIKVDNLIEILNVIRDEDDYQQDHFDLIEKEGLEEDAPLSTEEFKARLIIKFIDTFMEMPYKSVRVHSTKIIIAKERYSYRGEVL